MLYLITWDVTTTFYHLQLLKEFYHLASIISNPTEATAMGALEAYLMCYSWAVILAKSDRSAHHMANYHP